MNRILNLALSYPDFQLNQIIDPDQVDLNNKQLTDKVNELVTAINTFTQGSAGGTNVTITPLPEFPTATNVQTALQQIATFAKGNRTTIDEILAKNTTQDNRLTTLETRLNTNDAKDTSQDTTITNLTKTVNDNFTSLSSRITTNETVDSQQTSRLVIAESKLDRLETSEIPSIKADITKHTSDINSVKAKNTEQDARISSIETREEIDGTWISAIEGKVDINKTDIVQIKKDLSEISAINPSAELVEARTSGNTGVVYDKLSLRLDDNEIAVGVAIPNDKRTNINFHVTGEEGTGTWEDTVKLGSLDEHNASTDVHHGLIGSHELNMNSHADIRADVSNNNTTLTNKINLVEAKVGADMGVISAELNSRVDGVSNQISILSNDVMKPRLPLALSTDWNTLIDIAIYSIADISQMKNIPPNAGSMGTLVIYAETHNMWGGKVQEYIQNGTTWKRTFYDSVWSSWKQLATSDEISILSTDKDDKTNTGKLYCANIANLISTNSPLYLELSSNENTQVPLVYTIRVEGSWGNSRMTGSIEFDFALGDLYADKSQYGIIESKGVIADKVDIKIKIVENYKKAHILITSKESVANWVNVSVFQKSKRSIINLTKITSFTYDTWTYDTTVMSKIATTDKIDILCTQNTGYVIAQKNYQINNVVYIAMQITKSDSSVFATTGMLHIGTLPTGCKPSITTSISASSLYNGSIFNASCVVDIDGKIYITNSQTGATLIRVGGVIVL